jgi:L-lysine 6-transaminase
MKTETRQITPRNAIEVIGEHLLVDVFPVVLDLERSHGNYLNERRGGRFHLDCFSFIASNPIGHNHPKLNDPEFERKLLRVAKTRPSNSDIYTVEMAEFVDAFSRIALPETHPHLFFIDGGTLGVENALKVAMDWKVRFNLAHGGRGEG